LQLCSDLFDNAIGNSILSVHYQIRGQVFLQKLRGG